MRLLNFLLKLAYEESITSVQLDQNETPGTLGLEKGLRFDIHCHNQQGEPIVAEMQRNGTDLFKDRMLYYAASLIHQEIQSGDESYELPRIYVLCILNL